MPETWKTRGLCSDLADDTMFPNGSIGTPAVDYALAICARCPVIAECREYALRRRVAHGVWGGLTEQQRSRILTKRDREDGSQRQYKHGTVPGFREHKRNGEEPCVDCSLAAEVVEAAQRAKRYGQHGKAAA